MYCQEGTVLEIDDMMLHRLFITIRWLESNYLLSKLFPRSLKIKETSSRIMFCGFFKLINSSKHVKTLYRNMSFCITSWMIATPRTSWRWRWHDFLVGIFQIPVVFESDFHKFSLWNSATDNRYYYFPIHAWSGRIHIELSGNNFFSCNKFSFLASVYMHLIVCDNKF
jgi:hypothetical protein